MLPCLAAAPAVRNTQSIIPDLQAAALTLGLQLTVEYAGTDSDLETAFASFSQRRVNKEINAGLADSTMKARVADLGGTVLPGSPALGCRDLFGKHRDVYGERKCDRSCPQ
jgi:hypothetical protein